MFSIPDMRILIRDISDEIFYFCLKIQFFHNLAEIRGNHIAATSNEKLRHMKKSMLESERLDSIDTFSYLHDNDLVYFQEN